MKRRAISGGLTFLSLILLLAGAGSVLAKPQSADPPANQNDAAAFDAEEAVEQATPRGVVVIEGRPILTVYETLGTRTPAQRATEIERRLVAIASSGHITPEEVRVLPRESYSWIIAANQTVMAVTDGDAKDAGKPRGELAEEYAAAIRTLILNYRRDHGWRMILRGIAETTVATLVLVSILWLIRRVWFLLRDRIQKQIYANANLKKKSTLHASVAYLGSITLGVGAGIRWIVILGLFQTYLTVVFGFFSSTREISLTVTNWVVSQLQLLAQSFLKYLPNLLVLAVIALVTSYVIRLSRLLFREIGKGEFKVRGFYPDWAQPTEKLILILVLVLALIVAFPYLPGAQSPAFRGISIFLGLLLSLGSSSAVANAIAGVILTYMRSFLLGDWVQIGETTGEVIEKNFLVTRVLTPKAEIITIPNSAVMSGSVKNYSVQSKQSGVIFHTKVTIGYDAPWRRVHQLLVDAALATKSVLREPAPFVLQEGLNDFYVAYELNAYTNDPREMLNIFSDLHQNIQDQFNEAGVEICSPHFAAVRDGNVIALPEQYIRSDYRVPGFRIRQANGDNDSPSRGDLARTPTQTDS